MTLVAGIMNLTTAAYLSRDIMIYSYPTTPSGKYGITKIPSSDDESLPPLTVFYSEKHYQTLQKRTASDDTKKDPYNRDESLPRIPEIPGISKYFFGTKLTQALLRKVFPKAWSK